MTSPLDELLASPLDELLERRKSVRKYSAFPIMDEHRKLLKAAKQAPSAGGIRPVKIIMTDSMPVSKQKMFQFPCFVYVFCVDFPKIQKKYGKRGNRYALIEVGHMAQNLCLKAVELGLVSCCVGAFNDQKVRRFLQCEETPVYMVAVGVK